MFYHFLYPLRDIFFGFNVFRYITFRAAMCSVTAFLLSLWLGPFVIRKLALLNIGERVRHEKDCPGLFSLHRGKEGTPTMGGLLILASVLISVFLWADLTNKFILLTTFTLIWLGIVGFIDDIMKSRKGSSSGLPAGVKLTGQLILGLAIGLVLFYDPEVSQRLDIPFFKNLVVDLGLFYVFFVMLVIIGSSNAVNLTDGLDGLAIGCVVIVAGAFAILTYITGHIEFSNYLHIFYMPGSGELTVFCAGLVGGGLGFLWFNAHPAALFMGDTGSLALGGAIGVVAVFIKKEILLLLVGGIFVVEALSVILQVVSYKTRGRRIFLVAPLHHHFQLRGWPESKIIVRFWIVAIILALFSLSTLKLR